jgi:hypothetical protein
MKIYFDRMTSDFVKLACTLGLLFVFSLDTGFAEEQEFGDSFQGLAPGGATLTEFEAAINELSVQLQERAAEKLMNDAFARFQSQSGDLVGAGTVGLMVERNRDIARIQRQRAVQSMETVEGAGAPLDFTSPMTLLTLNSEEGGSDDTNDRRGSASRCIVPGFC